MRHSIQIKYKSISYHIIIRDLKDGEQEQAKIKAYEVIKRLDGKCDQVRGYRNLKELLNDN